MHTIRGHSTCERGATLVELMVALVVLALGVLAVAQLFPAGSRSQLRSRMLSTANYYAQDTIEQTERLTWADPGLAPGRHPSGTPEALGTTGAWHRYYDVDDMAAPLDYLRRVTVTVTWTAMRPETVTAVTYVRR